MRNGRTRRRFSPGEPGDSPGQDVRTMPGFPRAAVLATAIVCLTAARVTGPAAAADLPSPPLPGEIVWILGERPVAGATFATGESEAPPFDAALFGQELLAFALKEAFPDAEDEYGGSSGIRGPLDARPIDVRHRFGHHCLWAVNRLWQALGERLPPGARPGRFTRVRPDGATLLAGSVFAHGLWTALRNEIVDRRDGMALRPRISTRKVALEFRFRW